MHGIMNIIKYVPVHDLKAQGDGGLYLNSYVSWALYGDECETYPSVALPPGKNPGTYCIWSL